MRNLFPLNPIRLGCPDLEFAIDRDRLAIHDLAAKLARKVERQRGLSAGSGPKNHDQRRIRPHRAPQGMNRPHRTRMMTRMIAATISSPTRRLSTGGFSPSFISKRLSHRCLKL